MTKTFLVKNAAILVTMDGARREIPGGGLFIRDGFIEILGRANGDAVDPRDQPGRNAQ